MPMFMMLPPDQRVLETDKELGAGGYITIYCRGPIPLLYMGMGRVAI